MRVFVLSFLLSCLPALALAGPALPGQDPLGIPEILDTEIALSGWKAESGWTVSPLRDEQTGSRLSVVLVAESSTDVALQGRARPAGGHFSDWFDLEERWAGPEGHRILILDFGQPQSEVQLRVEEDPLALGVHALGWTLMEPVWERLYTRAGDAPELPPELSTEPSEEPSVSNALLDIGVVPREVWGADPTNCSTPEDNWYRFAIHHTAGNTTHSGTIEGAVQFTQAYAMNSGEYCDMPYQFMVGHDGSLWEGRPLDYRSGATGGGNNDGNIAISSMGCFDPSCGSPGTGPQVSTTISMLAGGRILAQTLADEHGITINTDTLRGHRDWPGNSTACPGDALHSQLDVYRSPSAHFEGEWVGFSWDEVVELEVGKTIELSLNAFNLGIETWTSNTRLAPLPRDVAHPLAASSWLSSGRITGPNSNTPQGTTATFSFEIFGAAPGSYSLSFALVEEAVTWFSDIPVGGGPEEGTMVLNVVVVESTGDDDDDDDASDDDDSVGDDDDASDDDDSTSGDDDDSAEDEDEEEGGEWVTNEYPGFVADTACGCSTESPDPLARPESILLVGLLLGFRRRLRL